MSSWSRGGGGGGGVMGYVLTSSGIYYEGHKFFKILSFVLGYHLPVACICYSHNEKEWYVWGQNLSQPVMEQILLGFQALSR